MNIDQIFEAFTHFDGKYKRKAVNAAIEQKEVITPHLINILEKLLANPMGYMKDDNDFFGYTYPLFLLSHFKEYKAHQIIIDLFSLPDRIPNKLFDTIVTEDLDLILLRTCNNSIESIKELVLNKYADEYCRGSAMNAITYAIIEGITTRGEVISFFRKLFAENGPDHSSYFYDLLAMCINDIHPEELIEDVAKAYAEGYIGADFLGLEDIKNTLQKSKEECMEKLKEKWNKKSNDDFHSIMSSWNCFDKDEQQILPPVLTEIGLIDYEPMKKHQKAQKAKKKAAKMSKKKNRKKK